MHFFDAFGLSYVRYRTKICEVFSYPPMRGFAPF